MASLEKIASLGADLLRYESRIEAVEENLKQLRAMHLRISTVELPEAMDAAEVTEFRMADGRRISVAPEYHASITKANEPAAFAWLRANGFDSIIKRDVSVKFGKGEDGEAAELLSLLCEHNYAPESKDAIHHSTLKAFVREMVEEGIDIPLDTFGALVLRRAKAS